MNGYKDIENRTWATRYRGPLLIQASASRPAKALIEYAAEIAHTRRIRLPDEYDLGGIVGMVHLDDCVTKHRSRWSTTSLIEKQFLEQP